MILAGEFDDLTGFYFKSDATNTALAFEELYALIERDGINRDNIVDVKIVNDISAPFDFMNEAINSGMSNIENLIAQYGADLENNTHYFTKDSEMFISVENNNVSVNINKRDLLEGVVDEQTASARELEQIIADCKIHPDNNNVCRWCAAAHMCGVSEQAVTNFINGNNEPSTQEIASTKEDIA